MAGEVTTRDEHDLLTRLDRAFAHQRRLDSAVLASIRAWQRTDRTYQSVQRLARGHVSTATDGGSGANDAQTVQDHLDIATASGIVPFPLRVLFTGYSGVMLDLLIPPGSRALWIAGLGDPALRRQGELLLPRDIQIDVYSHVHVGESVPVLLGGVVSDESIH